MRHNVILGKITSSHGVSGRVKILSYTEIPENLTAYGPLTDATGKEYQLRITGSAKGQLICEIEGIRSRNEADTLRGIELGVPRERIPTPQNEGEYLIEDLVGLKVLRHDGSLYGTIKSMHHFGAGDIAEIALEKGGKTELLPFNDDVFPSIDITNRIAHIDLPEIMPVSLEEKDVE